MSLRLADVERLALLALVPAGLLIGNRTAAAIGLVFAVVSLLLRPLARPELDALLGIVLLAHGYATLLELLETPFWGPALHFLTPAVLALALAVAFADRAVRRPLGLAFAVTVIVMFAWEGFELAANRLPGVWLDWSAADAREDLLIGFVGTLAGLAIAWLVVRREGSAPRLPA